MSVTLPEHQNRQQVNRTSLSADSRCKVAFTQIHAQVRVTANGLFALGHRQSAVDVTDKTQQISANCRCRHRFLAVTILSHFKPGIIVKTLDKTIEETYLQYDKHKDILDESAGLEDRINRLRVEAFNLQERHLQAYDEVSLTDLRSWRCLVGETKDIWVEARQRQREIVELKEELQAHMPRNQHLGHSGTGSRQVWGTTVKERERRSGAENLMEVPLFERVATSIQPPAVQKVKDTGSTPGHGFPDSSPTPRADSVHHRRLSGSANVLQEISG
ncbi:hypothetical protein EDD18DRAFT_1334898, partial [Armillaria luteobubalina]